MELEIRRSTSSRQRHGHRVANTQLIWRSAFSQFSDGLVERLLCPLRPLGQHLFMLDCRKVDDPVLTVFELLSKLLACSHTDASNGLEDSNRAPVTRFKTRELSIQILAV